MAGVLATVVAATPEPSGAAASPADLVVTLAPTSASVAAGGTASVVAKVRNVGGQTATGNIEVWFSIPWSTLAESPSFSGSGWSCPSTGTTCVWSGNLAVGAVAPDLTAAAPIIRSYPTSPGVVGFNATVSSSSDGVATDNTAHAELPIRPASGVDLVPRIDPVGTQVPAGSSAVFKVAAQNIGSASSSGSVEMQLGWSWNGLRDSPTFSGTGWSCPAGGTTCTRTGAVAAGATLPDITVTMPVVDDYPQSTGLVDLTATLTAASDAVTEDNQVRGRLPIVRASQADLVATLTPDVTGARAGTTTPMRLSIRNVGTAASSGATDVSLSWNWSGLLATPTMTGSGWSCPGGNGQCVTSAVIAAGAAAPDLVVNLPLDPAQATAGTVSVNATVSNPSDGVRGNESASGRVAILAPAPGGPAVDVAVQVSPPTPAAIGTTSAFPIRVTNAGTGSAAGPITVDVTGTVASLAGSGWTCVRSRSCSHPGPIAAGGTLPVLTATSPEVRSLSGRVTVDASVTTATVDPYPSNNSSSASGPIGGAGADLVATLDPAAPVAPGSDQLSTVTVANAGNAPSAGPFQVELGGGTVAATGTGWSCSRQQVCTRSGTLAPGSSFPAITATSTAGATNPNRLAQMTASVSAPDDVAYGNDSAQSQAVVGGPPRDLTVQVSAPAPVTDGPTLVSQVVVANVGAATVAGPTWVQLSSPFGSATASGDGWLCTSALRCVRDAALGAGSSAAPIELRVRVPAGTATGVRGFGASVRNAIDEHAGNDQVQIQTPIVRANASTGLQVELNGPLDAAVGSETTIPVTVTNVGPLDSTAFNLQLVGARGLSVTSVTGSGFSCGAASCDWPAPLEPGQQVSLEARVRVTDVAFAQTFLTARLKTTPAGTVASDSLAMTIRDRAADLVVVTSPLAASVGAGGAARFKLSVRNLGGAPSSGTTSLSFGSSWNQVEATPLGTGAGWTCHDTDGTCEMSAPIAPGAAAPDVIVEAKSLRTHPDAGRVRLSAWVTNRADGVSANNSSAATMAVRAPTEVDLVTSMVPLDASVTAGGSARFRIDVRNLGTSASTGPIETGIGWSWNLLTDYPTSSGSGWSCPRGRSICTYDAAIPAGGAAPPITVSAPTDRTGQSSNGVISVNANTTNDSDAITGNQWAAAQVPVVSDTAVDFAAVLSPVTRSPRTGGDATLRLLVRNVGTATSSQPLTVDINHNWSALRDSVRGSGTGWVCPPTILSCTYTGTVAAGASAPALDLVAPLAEETSPSRISVTASVSSPEDHRPENDGGGIDLAVRPAASSTAADLAVSAVPGPLVAPGGTATAAITVDNLSGTAVTAPTTISVNGASERPTGSGWACTASNVCSNSDPVPAGGSLPALNVNTATSLPNPVGRVDIGAYLESSQDTNGSNNYARSGTPVGGPVADLVVTGVAGAPVAPGGTATQVFTVTNGGNATSADEVAVQINVGAADPTASGSGWTCSASLACTRSGSLAPGASAPTLTLTYPVPAKDPSRAVDAYAYVTNTSDARSGNNQSRSTASVGGSPADLSASISGAGPVVRGQTLDLQVAVANGGAAAPSGDITVQLSAPFGNAVASGSGWGCTSQLACSRTGAVPAGGTLPPIQVRVPVPEWAGAGTYSVTAGVVADQDVYAGNNQAEITLPSSVPPSITTLRSPSMDVQVTPARARAGDEVSIRLELAPPTTSRDRALPVSLALPAGLSYVSGSVTGASVTGSDGSTLGLSATVPASADSLVVSARLRVANGATIGDRSLEATLEHGPSDREGASARLSIVTPAIGAVTPATAGRAKSVTLTVQGSDLAPATSVQLKRGASTIAASDINPREGGALAATFDLSSAATGAWDLVVIAGATTTTKSSAVTVVERAQAELSMDVTGPAAVRLNGLGRYRITVTNTGTIDALEVPVSALLPTSVQIVVAPQDRASAAAVVDWLAAPTDGSSAALTTAQATAVKAKLATASITRDPSDVAGFDVALAGYLPKVPAGQSRSFEFTVRPGQVVTAPIRFSLLHDTALDPSTGQIARLIRKIAVPQHVSAAGSTAVSNALIDDADCGVTQEEREIMGPACETAGDITRSYGHIVEATGDIAGVDPHGLTAEVTADVLDHKYRGVPKFAPLVELWSQFKNLKALFNAADKIDKEFKDTRFGVQSIDPNDKLGPIGVGAQKYVAAGDLMAYLIRFENVKTATAPAQRITVRDQLDSDLDWATARVTTFSAGGVTATFGDPTTVGDVSRSVAQVVVPFGGGTPVVGEAEVNTATGAVAVTISGPDQMDDPENPTPFGDFLPPNTAPPEGDGSVGLEVRSKRDLPTGRDVVNAADIVFDDHLGGPTIATPPVSNTIDATPPAVSVQVPTVAGGTLSLGWSAADPASGIAAQKVFVEVDGTITGSQSVAAALRQTTVDVTATGSVRLGVSTTDGTGNISPVVWTSAVDVDPTTVVPGTPTNVTATAGDQRATVAWTAPAAPAGSLTGFVITPYAGATAKSPVTVGGASSSHVITGLVNGTTYTFKVAAMNATGTGPQSTASNSVTPRARFAPFASWSALVTRQYLDVTGKKPSSAAAQSWISQLNAGTKTKGDLVDSLRRGQENLTNVDPVVRVYRAFLGRAPDPGGLGFWIRRKRNVAPAKTWSVTQIATEFTKSNEFQTKYGKLTNRKFVTQIYTDVLGRPADASGVNYWTGKLDRKERTKAQVVVGFSESNEYKTKQLQNTDAAVAYLFLLGKAPSPTQLASWVVRQKAGTSEAVLIAELLDSPAYATRVGG